MSRFYLDALIPILTGAESTDALNRFRTYYYDNGGNVLEDILTRWYTRGGGK
jgi:hypothetical protein